VIPGSPFWPGTLQPPCFGRKPKARVTTSLAFNLVKFINPALFITFTSFFRAFFLAIEIATLAQFTISFFSYTM
jgi:hypothetical protein